MDRKDLVIFRPEFYRPVKGAKVAVDVKRAWKSTATSVFTLMKKQMELQKKASFVNRHLQRHTPEITYLIYEDRKIYRGLGQCDTPTSVTRTSGVQTPQ